MNNIKHLRIQFENLSLSEFKGKEINEAIRNMRNLSKVNIMIYKIQLLSWPFDNPTIENWGQTLSFGWILTSSFKGKIIMDDSIFEGCPNINNFQKFF